MWVGLGVLVLFENSIVCQCTFVAWVCVTCPVCTVWWMPVFGCVPVVAWLNSNDGSRHLLVHSVRGVWLNMFHVFFDQPPLCPVGLGVGVEPL